MPAATFQKLSFMQLSSLESDQAAVLTTAQLASLTAAQVNYLTSGQLGALGSKIQSLSASAVTGLNNTHLIEVYASLSATQVAALTAAQKTVVQQAGTAVTALLAKLTDASVRAQVTAVINAGQSLFSYGALLKVLQGVDAAIGTTGLTLAQLNDLKALTTAVGQSQGTTSYLYRIVSDVVNGNKSNATWTGGAATSVALGNLAVGSSADQMGKLISKWFLGGDLPTWGGSTGYTTINGPLFSAAGPLSSEISQAGIGDCYLIAAMVDVADDYASLLETMFTDNGNGTWGVRLYATNDDPLYVTVSNVLPGGWGRSTTTTDSLWVSLLEKAYVEWEVQTYNAVNAYSSIEGGWDTGMIAISGRNTRSYGCNGYTLASWTTTVKSSVVSALATNQEVMFATGSGTSLLDPVNGKTDLVGSHMFAVLGYDAAKDGLILRNPWGSAGSSTWNGVFTLTFSQLYLTNCSLLVTTEASPTGAIDAKYNVNASVDQLLQVMSTDSGAGGGASTSVLGANSQDTPRITLLAAA